MTQALNASEPGHCTDLGGKYLTFLLQGQTYGLDILRIREIVGWRRIIPIVSTTPHLRGLINLGGGILPVVDLRASPSPLSDHLPQEVCIIIALTAGMQLAILAEKVLDVCNVPKGQVLRTAPQNACVPARFILGVADVSGNDVILLDVSRILSEDDIKAACAPADGKTVTT